MGTTLSVLVSIDTCYITASLRRAVVEMSTGALAIEGERFSGQDIRAQNGA